MAIKTAIRDGIIHIVFSGMITYEEIIEQIDFMFTLKDKMENRYMFHDHTHTERIDVSADDIRHIAVYSKKLKDIFNRSFVAVYAPEDLSFGTARMFELLFELEKHPVSAEIFRDKEAAMQFLKEKMAKYGQQPE